jgi:hypothetical protein
MRPGKEFDMEEVEKLAGFGMTYEEMPAFLECGPLSGAHFSVVCLCAHGPDDIECPYR